VGPKVLPEEQDDDDAYRYAHDCTCERETFVVTNRAPPYRCNGAPDLQVNYMPHGTDPTSNSVRDMMYDGGLC